MDGDGTYELRYDDRSRAEVRRELAAMRTDPLLKQDYGRLLRSLQDLAERGAKARNENIQLSSLDPPLHLLMVGNCTLFYAYGEWNGAAAIYLLGFYRKGTHLVQIGTAAKRLSQMP